MSGVGTEEGIPLSLSLPWLLVAHLAHVISLTVTMNKGFFFPQGYKQRCINILDPSASKYSSDVLSSTKQNTLC